MRHRYNPAPRLENPVKEWHPVAALEVPVQWLHLPADGLTRQVGNLYHRIERYVLQKLEAPGFGRGTTLQYVHRPLSDPSKP